MPRRQLTDKFVRSVTASAGGRQEYLDAIVPQLMLRIGSSGAKSWALLARYPGFRHPTRRALGPVFLGPRPPAEDPDIYERDGAALTLAEAREKARRWLELISRKIDPAEARKASEAAAAQLEARAQLVERSTFGAVAEEWIKRHDGHKKAAEAERLIRREFMTRWEPRPIAAIMPREVAAAVRAIIERHTGTTATGRPAGTFQAFAAYGYLRQIFNWAIGSGEFDITASPFAALRQKDVLGDKTARDRVLDDDELRAVWSAASELGYPWGDCVRLLILSGQRLREIADLSWREIDLGERLVTIAGSRMKSHRAHEVPLGDRALELLEGVPRWSEGRGFVFSNSGGRRAVAGFSRTKARLDELSGVRDWILHDLRRTMRTRLSALAIEDRVREAMIAHAAPGLHQVYDLHKYQAEKRHGFVLWETRLTAILDVGQKVVRYPGR